MIYKIILYLNLTIYKIVYLVQQNIYHDSFIKNMIKKREILILFVIYPEWMRYGKIGKIEARVEREFYAFTGDR